MACLLWLLLVVPDLAAPLRWDTSPFIISESDRGELSCPMECPHERGRPICGSDGRLYKSPCTFQRARCRDASLEALPRFRCGGAAHREPNSTNLTRCQEDRMTALSQSRRQAHATYVPECDEDGSFHQVQCHKQTGYCWCSTPEGKPVSGTSVLNGTPNCTGSYTVRTSWQDPNSSRREEGARPRPTQPSPLPHRQEEGTSLPFLIPIIIPDFKPNRTVKQVQEYPPSCEQERREAIDEARQHQQEGTFIPECEGDGTYKAVQCHQATGYCWCVRVDTGRPVPGTSTRNFPPDCDSDAAAKSTEMGSLFRDRTLPGCPGPKKAEFLSNLIKALATDMLQSRMMPVPYRRFSDSMVAPSLEERAVRWQFVRLDKDFSNSISERELRPLKLYMKKNTRPKRCVRKFLDYCDLNENKLISLHELKGCLGLS
ncbi:SPARC-related modular calcium-binding protein 1-like isoform X2 [Sceloporus undulatus]|uniref:SPARC-related modular calcium-binding protein 1-like isoform X2 n=1 Tax=Sceloporus undulatus TaxID=8520 RepID=UPI001C4D76BB|nr:SPARC-related modular calcium-binding protein 1-like isoform X2 [Sceloporus undulatus]